MNFESFYLFKDIRFVYLAILSIASFGLVISSIEDLKSFHVFRKGGILSWNVTKYRSEFLAKKYASFISTLFMNERGFLVILSLKLIGSVLLLVFSINGFVCPGLIAFELALLLLVTMRSYYGLDGAHQMNVIIMLALAIAAFSGVGSEISSLCIWFIACELILAYFIAGINKIISPIWRNTHALNAIFSTKVYGSALIYNLVKRSKPLAYVLCWSMLAFEMLFVGVLFSEHACLGLCAVGFGFHLFNALFMGLNTFMFAFLSAYPAILFCSFR